jgi:hypothetical protein
MKYDTPLLDRDTRFALWQVKMQVVLSQADLDDTHDKFRNKDSKIWSDDEKRKIVKLCLIFIFISQTIFCKRFCGRKPLLLYGLSWSQFACQKI